MHRILRIVAPALIFSGIIIITISLSSKLDTIAFNPNPLVRHFAPAWRSIKKIIDMSLKRAEEILTKNRKVLDKMANELSIKETLEREDLEKLLPKETT